MKREGPMSQCDACNVSVVASTLVQLRPQYQSDGICYVCGVCYERANEAIASVLQDVDTRKVAAVRTALLGEGQ